MAEPESEIYKGCVEKILELCAEHLPDLPLPEQRKPRRNRVSQVTTTDKALARDLVDEAATLAHKRRDLLVRVLVKPPLLDDSIVTATIARHVKHCRRDDSGHVLEALLDQLAATSTPVELRTVVDELLCEAVKRKGTGLVGPLAARASQKALNIALHEALLRQHARCVKCLLGHGADPNFLGLSYLRTVMIDDVETFERLMRAQHHPSDEFFGPLCTAAVRNCGPRTLSLLLRARCHPVNQKAARWDRDGLMKELLKTRKFDMFHVLAALTVHLPLTTGSVLLDAIESTRGSHVTRAKVIEVLLCLTRDFEAVASAHLAHVFSRLILENDSETLSVLVKYTRTVPAEAIGLICRLGALDLLDIILCDRHVGRDNAGTTSPRVSFDASHILDLIRAMLTGSTQVCPDTVELLLGRAEPFFSSPTEPTTACLYNVLSSSTEQNMQNGLEARMVSVLEVTQNVRLRYRHALALGQARLDDLLISAAQYGLARVAEALLKLGASPHPSDTRGRSALFFAVLGGHERVVRVLVDGQARVNDGSLHAAACEEQWKIMRILQAAGHSPFYRCEMFEWATALEAYVRHAYSPWPLVLDKFGHTSSSRRFPSEDFPTTIAILMHEEHPNSSTARAVDIVSVLVLALSKPHTRALVGELLSHIEKYTLQGILSPQHVFGNGPLRFSVLGLVERWPKVALDPDDRQYFIERMHNMEFQPVFYTLKGDQPSYAVGVPEALMEAQRRRTALNSKECSVHCAREGREEDIHAGLTPACATTHGWDDMIICTDCLRNHLEARMFPLDDPEIRYKFPTTTVPCWAPDCRSILDHDVIKKHVTPEVFTLYDDALLQQHLRTGKSTVKCAKPGCPGAIWFVEEDVAGFTLFLCLECEEYTCVECNDMYAKHTGQPCPAGESRRLDERLQREEALSKAALDREKKCPGCGLAYEHLSGCDHITCGRNTHDSTFDGKLTPVTTRTATRRQLSVSVGWLRRLLQFSLAHQEL